jgi:hypothetical protein
MISTQLLLKRLKIFKWKSKTGVVSSWILRFRGNREICVIRPDGKKTIILCSKTLLMEPHYSEKKMLALL